MPNCPICGHKLNPYNTSEERVVLAGMDLPICKDCAAKRKAEKQPKITGAASPSDFYFKSGKTSAEVKKK